MESNGTGIIREEMIAPEELDVSQIREALNGNGKPKRKYTKKSDFWAVDQEAQQLEKAQREAGFYHVAEKLAKIPKVRSNIVRAENFTSREICAIIEACGKSQVVNFNYQGLALSFGTQGSSLGPTVGTGVLTNAHDTNFEGSKNLIPWGDEEHRLNDEHAQLLMDDPVAFEQAMTDSDQARERRDIEREVYRGTKPAL